MRINTNGVTRIVLLTRFRAYKFPAFNRGWRMGLEGLLANMQEQEFGTIGSPALAPVTWSLWGGWLTVQRRCQPLTDAQWQAFDYQEFQHSAWGSDLVENKRDGFGTLDGAIVGVDYG